MRSGLGYSLSILVIIGWSKKAIKVFKPLSFASFPTLSEGSIPMALILCFFSGFNRIPSLEPISTINLYLVNFVANFSKCIFNFLFTEDK